MTTDWNFEANVLAAPVPDNEDDFRFMVVVYELTEGGEKQTTSDAIAQRWNELFVGSMDSQQFAAYRSSVRSKFA